MEWSTPEAILNETERLFQVSDVQAKRSSTSESYETSKRAYLSMLLLSAASGIHVAPEDRLPYLYK